MKRKVFQSSNLHSGEYDPKSRTLTLRFGNGSAYRGQVPPEVWDKLTSAQSPGSFFHKFVKPNFPLRRVDRADV